MGIFDFFKKKTGEAENTAGLEKAAEEKEEMAEAGLMPDGNLEHQAEAEQNPAKKAAAGEETAERFGAAEAAREAVQTGQAEQASADFGKTSEIAADNSAHQAETGGAEKNKAAAENNSTVGKEESPYQTTAQSGQTENAVTGESGQPMPELTAAGQEPDTFEPEPAPVAEEAPVKKGFFRKLVEGLSKTRQHVMQGVNDVLSSFTSIDEEFYEELEEALIMGDLGVNTAIKIVAGLKTKVKERKIKDPQQVKSLLKEELKEQMRTAESAYDFINQKSVILVIGVNGVGKTTTIGKLAAQYKKDGKQVMLAAADTFRAAAIDQLKEWARRSDVPIVAQAENSDPGAVIFDAIASAKSKGIDILICDTAGRLHNKKNLMAELGKIYRIIGREYPEAHLEVFLVLDSTTGQNALAQAKEFKEMADITGIVLTKLDGTSKGGIAVAIAADLALPVKYIGVGEGIEDLRPFDADSFIEALFEE